MIKYYLIFLVFSFVQANSPIKNFIIGFWPEYDHPGVLVSIQIESDSTKLPYNLNLEVPINAKMVIETEIENNEKINNILAVESKENNLSTFISAFIKKQKYLLQFYFNPFDKGSIKRDMKYFISSDIDLYNFYIVIQKHLGAKNYSINLENMETIVDSYGITYFRKNINNLLAGDSILVEISYQNANNKTTMDILNSQQSDLDKENKKTNNVSLENNYKNRDLNIYYNNKLYILLILIITTVLIFILYVIYNNNDVVLESFIPCNKCKKMINKIDKFCSYCGDKNVS